MSAGASRGTTRGHTAAASEPPDTVAPDAAGQDTQPPPAGAPDRATNPAPSLPETFADGRYRVTGQLGVGGMGIVLRARDEVLDRDVAVKLLADNLSHDEGSRTRFLREARAAAAIADPRVVGVFDVGEEAGRPYLIMELVDGPSLAEVLASDGPLSSEDALAVATDALAGLGCAHEAGLLHRDVKPGNLLCGADGTTKVTDFGVAIAVDGDRMTRTGFVIGTAAYLAPERRRGEGATVRTDLWALGATLTELLTGHPPGEDADRVLAARGEEVTAELRRLLRRLLATDPQGRPQDALEALAILAGEGTISHAATPPAGTRTRSLPARSGYPLPSGATPPGGATPSGARSATPGPDIDTAPHRIQRRRPRWQPALLLLAGIVVAALTVLALVDSGRAGTAPADRFGPVVVDPADPEATVRELGEQLRGHAAR